MAEALEEDVSKKKRRAFQSPEDRNQAAKERKKLNDSRRISLGSAWPEYERQKSRNVGHTEFIHHLLALHEMECRTCNISRDDSTIKNRIEEDACTAIEDEIILGTPQKNRTNPAIPLPDVESPILPTSYSLQRSTLSEGSTWTFIKNSQAVLPIPSSSEPANCETPYNKQIRNPATSTQTPGKKPPDGVEASSDEDEQETESENDDISSDHLDDTTNILFSDDEDSDPDWEDKYQPTPKLRVTMTKDQAIKGEKCIAYNNVLETLLKAAIGDSCKKCNDFLTFEHVKIGTCLIIKWKCPCNLGGHSKGSWASQPVLFRMYAGNLLTSAALVLSGNNYAKVALMAKFLNLNFISKASFYRVQQKYVCPAVGTHWKNMQTELLEESTDGVVLAGDGRNDSPGHCAKYCTYSLMNVATNKIVSLCCIDCRETDLNSVIMERVGFKRAMSEVMAHCKVEEVVTDAHPQISALMRKDETYKDITHQYDLWHVSKSLSKKLAAAGREKGCEDILKWMAPIRNHLWFCSQECQGDVDFLKALWPTCYYHVCDQHEWLDTTLKTQGCCSHPIPLPETEERPPWIKPGSKAQSQLRSIIFDKTLMKKMPYIRNFRHTGQLELFHALLLMYCPKRLAFTYRMYVMRNQLAVLDHNYHVDRRCARNKATGQERYRASYSKATKTWSAGVVKEPKEYKYIWKLLEEIVNLRELAEGVEYIAARVSCTSINPSLPPNIAAVPRPSTQELISRHQSRFSSS